VWSVWCYKNVAVTILKGRDLQGGMDKLKPKFVIADKFLDLKTMDPSMLIEHLEEQIQVREMSVQERVQKMLKRV